MNRSIAMNTKRALVIIAALTVLSSCNYKVEKVGKVDGSSFGIGTNSAAEQKAIGVLTTACASCHGSGTGAGGVSNITSPQALLNSGLIIPGSAAVSPLLVAIESGRMPPGGPIPSNDIQALRDWINGSGGGGSTPGGAIKDPLVMVDRNTPELYFGTGRAVTHIWDLSGVDVSTPATRFPGVFLMDVQVRYQTVGTELLPVGYQFTNPRIQMLSGEVEVEVEGVIVRINGVQPKGTEPFLSARKVAKGIDPSVVYSGTVNAPLPVVSTADKISVGFGYFQLRARTDNPPIPPNPTLTSNVAFTAAAQFGITVANDTTARRWCLTASTAVPTSTAAFCPGYEGSLTTTGWLTARPTNFDLVRVGRPLNPNETITFYVWVANSDLKISRAPGMTQVTFDAIPPSAPALGSVSLSATQIADINGLQDSNELVTWCAVEGAAQANVQNSNGCQFTGTKPTYIGLKGAGVRFVAVFARDRAGNLARSNIVSVNNTYGRISFDQLTNAATGARAVFLNRCATCHGAGAPNQLNWDASSYADTVAKKTQILNRIESGTQPMPPTGLIDERERALIRLWFTQTTTPVQL